MDNKKRIFLSYSRQDKVKARQIVKDLNDYGIFVWFDLEEIKPGSIWDNEIEIALTSSDTVLFLASPNSTTSKNVLNELSYADETNKSILPIIIENCSVPLRYHRFQRIDLTHDYSEGIELLKAALNHYKHQHVPSKSTTEDIAQAPKTETNNTAETRSASHDNAEKLLTVSGTVKEDNPASAGLQNAGNIHQGLADVYAYPQKEASKIMGQILTLGVLIFTVLLIVYFSNGKNNSSFDGYNSSEDSVAYSMPAADSATAVVDTLPVEMRADSSIKK